MAALRRGLLRLSRGPLLADKSTMVRLIVVLTSFIAIGSSLELAAQTSQAPQLASLKSSPASVVIAQAEQYRDEGRFSDAIVLLEAALKSPYGQASFQNYLSEAVATANDQINAEARDGVLRAAGVKSFQGNPLEVSILDQSVNDATGIQKARIDIRSFLPQDLSSPLRQSLLQRVGQIIQGYLSQKMPDNNLSYVSEHQMFFLEGTFNSEFPSVEPLVDLELGLLYKDNQDFLLAESHLKDALKNRKYLPVPEREYEARYALAEIYGFQGQSKDYLYEHTLLDISDQDRAFKNAEGAIARQRQQQRDLLLNDADGLNKILQLYRLPDDFTTKAHRDLARFYLERGNFEEALPHALFALIKETSKAMDVIRDLDYGYSFSTLTDFFREARRFPEVMNFLKDNEFYDVLYDLSRIVPLYKPFYFPPSRQIWTVLSTLPESGQIQLLARAQLRQSSR